MKVRRFAIHSGGAVHEHPDGAWVTIAEHLELERTNSLLETENEELKKQNDDLRSAVSKLTAQMRILNDTRAESKIQDNKGIKRTP